MIGFLKPCNNLAICRVPYDIIPQDSVIMTYNKLVFVYA